MSETGKEQILAAAMAVFGEKGFAKASMNDIVRASGMSKGGVYWYFTSKDEIITAIFDHFFLGQLAQLQAILALEGSATDKLLHFVRFTGQELQAMTKQIPSPLEFYALAARDQILHTRMKHYFALYREQIKKLVETGISSGEWSDLDVETTVDTLIALFEGILLLWSVTPDFDLIDRVEGAISLLLQGLQRGHSKEGK